MSEDEADLFEAINSGAQGYLLKRLKSDVFFDLISGVASGEAPISPKMAAKMIAALSGHAQPGESSGRPSTLTEREMEVLGHMAGGESNKRIAANLVISESTVKYHIRNILDKLHLENRAQVIAYAMRLGLGADITPAATKFLTSMPRDGEPL